MAGGGADGPVGVDGHDVQIAQDRRLHKGAEVAVHQVQQLLRVGHHIGLIVLVGPAPAGHRRVGHGNKVHVLDLQTTKHGLLGEPEDVGEGHIRLHVVLEHLDKLVQLRQVLHLKKLLHHGLQKGLLGGNAAQIAIGIAQRLSVHPVVVPVADDLHGVVAGEEAIALLLMDVEVLRGVVVVHIPGHVEVHAAHGVHDLTHGVPFHHHLIIRLKAHQLRDLLIEVLDALLTRAVVIVNGVDPLDIPRDVHHGVPGNGHDRGLLIGHIIACQEHGVRIPAAAGITAQN